MLKKKLIYLIIIVIALLIFSQKPYSDFCYRIIADFFHPFISVPNSLNETLKTKSLLVKTKQELIDIAFELQKKNLELQANIQNMEIFKEQNNKLRNLLNIAPIPEYEYVFAEVSFRDPAKWYQQFVINKGYYDGVKEGAIVISQSRESTIEKPSFSVTGRIGIVSKHTSVVYTLMNSECNISVRIPANGANGILKGGARSLNKVWADIEYLPKDLVYEKGALVVTSGLTPLAPQGLTVGFIDTQRIEQSKNPLYSNAMAEIVADLNHIDYVLVLVKKI